MASLTQVREQFHTARPISSDERDGYIVYVSKVDKNTMEKIKRLGLRIVSKKSDFYTRVYQICLTSEY